MKTDCRHGAFRLLGLGLLGATGALGLLAAPMQAWAGPNPNAYGDGYGGGYRADYDVNRYRTNARVVDGQLDPYYVQTQTAQRCNVGRLVGGIVGGGLGYAASRREGRAWAVPLGALLGQQMGCSVGAGRAPLPW